MKVLLAENAGFCFGVKLAVDEAIKTQNKYNKKIYTLGPLIHNSDVVNYLEENNIIVGVGSACNEKTKTLERSVYALTNSIERSYNMIRISLSHHNTYQEIDYLIEKLQELGNR